MIEFKFEAISHGRFEYSAEPFCQSWLDLCFRNRSESRWRFSSEADAELESWPRAHDTGRSIGSCVSGSGCISCERGQVIVKGRILGPPLYLNESGSI